MKWIQAVWQSFPVLKLKKQASARSPFETKLRLNFRKASRPASVFDLFQVDRFRELICELRYAAALLLTLTLLWGCAATPAAGTASIRCFDFNEDTFAYPNELLWEYSYDANGKWTTHKRDP